MIYIFQMIALDTLHCNKLNTQQFIVCRSLTLNVREAKNKNTDSHKRFHLLELIYGAVTQIKRLSTQGARPV